MKAGYSARFYNAVLDRSWLLRDCSAPIRIISMPEKTNFHIVQDDLIHPTWGNKARKLDALLPALLRNEVTDVVTVGGLQSAHTSAVASAVALACPGMRTHFIIRGERPAGKIFVKAVRFF